MDIYGVNIARSDGTGHWIMSAWLLPFKSSMQDFEQSIGVWLIQLILFCLLAPFDVVLHI